MKQLINIFSTTVSENNGTITVHYKHDTLTLDAGSQSVTGSCEYKIVEVNNRFKQKAWILTNTDMGDVIEYIHSNSPLKSEDLQDVNKLIRDHSLSRVRDLAR